MPIKKRDLRRSLLKKFGFEEVEGKPHEAVELIIDGRKVATTRFSRGHNELTHPILTVIARELWVQLGFLKGMHSCTKERDDYLDHLRRTGRLT